MNRIRNAIKGWLLPVAGALLLSLTIKTYVVEAVQIPSESMEPTLLVNDRLFVEKITPTDEYQVGDVIVFHPHFSSQYDLLIKRIVGVEGDKIEIRGGVLYRNDQKVSEPYIKERMTYEFGPVYVPKGSFLVLGDNRNESYDSHLWEDPFVKQENVIGKAIFRYYPLTRIHIM